MGRQRLPEDRNTLMLERGVVVGGSRSPKGSQQGVGGSLLPSNEGVTQDNNDGVTTQEHFGDVAVFVDRFGLFLPLPALGHLRPHLLDILQHHVAVPGGGKRWWGGHTFRGVPQSQGRGL